MENVSGSHLQALPEGTGEIAEMSGSEDAAVTGPGRFVVVMFLSTALLIGCVAVGEFILKLLR
jgi:hypothetical protein